MQGRLTDHQGRVINTIDCSDIQCWHRLPICLRILLENCIRHQPDKKDIWVHVFEEWLIGHRLEIGFYPARVLMQDLTGVPALADLAMMRDAVSAMGKDMQLVNPKCQVDLVVDHSIIVDHAKDKRSFEQNVKIEVARNKERYAFLKWAEASFSQLNIVPPGKGICHQVNLEFLADVVTEKDNWWYPDTLVGLDSHTPMINGLGVLAWGVGGIEAEAAMLGQPIDMALPEVIGVELIGSVKEGVGATDIVLHLTAFFRKKGVVGKFLEFTGTGVNLLSLAERATIANMAPEYGATCAFFPFDEKGMDYLALTGRSSQHISRVERYIKTMALGFHQKGCEYSELLTIDLSTIDVCMAGPERPDQKCALSEVKKSTQHLKTNPYCLSDASVVIAAITSCTNTSNPSVLIAAGLLARKAREKGLRVPSWVKTSFAPGSKVVINYLERLNLIKDLEYLGFYLVGYGCTTCIGNSGPLSDAVNQVIDEKELTVAAVLSGNRNFEGRVHPKTKLNYLASPALVVAYAIAGTIAIDFEVEPLADHVYLKDIWPINDEIAEAMKAVTTDSFKQTYQTLFEGEADWASIPLQKGDQYPWNEMSTYITKPPFLDKKIGALEDILSAKILAIFGDNITTDHISPAGSILPNSPAGRYLMSKGINKDLLHSYGARRGNADVMVRGTFANPRLMNKMVPSHLGGYTQLNGKVTSLYDAAMQCDQPLVVFAGKHYGMGSSRDWAAKGTHLLGIRAVIAKSFERIHRSNLIGMGVLPCVMAQDIVLTGNEVVHIKGIQQMDTIRYQLVLLVNEVEIPITAAIETYSELRYYQQGGILPYVFRAMSSDL